MKRLVLSIALCSLFGGAGRAATVSGTVTSVATCATVSGQKVFLRDSLSNTVDSAVTNTSGVYSINFPAGWPTPKSFQIAIPACGTVQTTIEKYHGISMTMNQIICGTPKMLNGTVMLGTTPNTGPARVYLVRVQRNRPVAGDTTLTAVDSVTLTNSPNFTFRRACTPTDTFLVKAVLLPAHASYANWMPSYDSSLTWSTAVRYFGASFNGMPRYLYMIAGTNPGGPGFIGGSVLAGANKQSAVGDPLPARQLILVNTANNKPVAYTYSDAAGRFSFPSVAVGTYRLFGDAWGLNNIPMTVVISAGAPTVNNIIFEEHYTENTFRGRLNTTGVGATAGPLAGVSIYPNPATKVISLMGAGDIRGSKTVALRNIVGATVITRHFSDGEAVIIPVDGMPAGTYMLELATSVGSASFKVVR